MNRMKSIQVMLLAVLLLILAACSNTAGQPASGEQSPAASQTRDQAAAEPGTRTITHLKGEAVIPAKIEKSLFSRQST